MLEIQTKLSLWLYRDRMARSNRPDTPNVSREGVVHKYMYWLGTHCHAPSNIHERMNRWSKFNNQDGNSITPLNLKFN